MSTAVVAGSRPAARRAPLARLLRSEVRWVVRRPRTQIALGLLALVPVLIGIGIVVADRQRQPGGGGLLTQVAGNGLVLPVATLALALALLLPLTVAMAAADALAGESAHGTLRGLLLAPVSRARLVLVKSVGVLAVAVAAVAAVTVLGLVTGLVLVGGGDLLTLSGTEVGLGSGLLRVGLAAAWTVGQLAAVGAVALAISSATDHPLVVLAATLGGLIVFGVLAAIPSLDWLQPVLLTTGWTAIADVLRDPLPLDDLATSSYRAACYLVLGLSLTLARTLTREA